MDKTYINGNHYGFNIGDSKEKVFNELQLNYLNKNLSVYWELGTNDKKLNTHENSKYGVFRIILNNDSKLEYPLIKINQWELNLEGTKNNYIYIKFEDNRIKSLRRVRYIFEGV